MRTGKRAVVVLAAAVVAVVVGSVAVPVGPPGTVRGASAQAAPSLVVDPADRLVDAQRVTVRGSGLPSGQFVQLSQCTSSARSVDDPSCRHDSAAIDDAGAFETEILVRALLGPEEVDCRVPPGCVLIAFLFDETAGEYVEVARAPLPFAPDSPLVPPPTLSVVPSDGLADGDTVAVSGAGVVADYVEVVQCTAAPSGWQDCDQESFAFADVLDGAFETSTRVYAVIRTAGGDVDCRAAGACALVATSGPFAPGDTAAVPLTFDPDAPLLPPPTLTVTPATDLVDGAVVRVEGAGFVRPSAGWVQLHQCAPAPTLERCRQVTDDLVVDPEGGFARDVPVAARVPLPDGDHDCRTSADPCLLVATAAWSDWSHAVVTELHFDPDAPLLPDPAIEVSTGDGLGDFTEVTVTGTGFTPAGRVTVQVCRTGATSGACDTENGETPTADPTGAIDTAIAVFAASRDDEAGSELDCRQPPGCDLVATDGARGTAARVPLVFGPPDAPRGRYLDPIVDEVEVTRDVVYRETLDHHGNPVELALDIYRPAGDRATERPVIVWLYGGWFIFGDKSEPYIQDFATETARRGYVGVAVNYRVRPDMSQTDIPQLLQAGADAYDDAVAAVEWLKAHATDYGIDPDAIAASGWSAGAVTSLSLAYTPGSTGPDTSPIAAAMPVAGVMFATVEAGEPPSIVFYATHDSTLPAGTNNTDTVCPAAQAVGIPCELVTYDGADHGIIYRPDDILRRGTDFLAANVLEPRGYFDVEADAGGPYEVDEGSTVELDASASSGATTYAWTPADRLDSATAARPTFTGVDDRTEQLTVTATNDHGIGASATAEVTTRNVAPTFTDAGVEREATGLGASLTAVLSDPGLADTHTATVDWGDGTVEQVAVTPGAGTATVGAGHAYAAGGTYEVRLTVADDDGGQDSWIGEAVVGCTIVGTERTDVLLGTRGDDIVCGLGGDDILVGGDGHDVVLGGDGNDLVAGGPGDDLLDGERGRDLVLGGGGADSCVGEVRLGCGRRGRR